MRLVEFTTNIRRRETKYYDFLYRLAKYIRSINMPVIRPLYKFLYCEREIRRALWHGLVQFIYYEPMFKVRCDTVGNGLKLVLGIPRIAGNLHLNIGNNVTLHGVSTFNGAKVFSKPTLIIGDNSHIGYQVTITVGRDVSIGSNVLIANRVNIISYDGHSTNPAERHNLAPKESSKPIIIKDNVWIGANSIILKGVTIGEGSVVANSSVVTSNVPPNCIAIGNPARSFPMII